MYKWTSWIQIPESWPFVNGKEGGEEESRKEREGEGGGRDWQEEERREDEQPFSQQL